MFTPMLATVPELFPPPGVGPHSAGFVAPHFRHSLLRPKQKALEFGQFQSPGRLAGRFVPQMWSSVQRNPPLPSSSKFSSFRILLWTEHNMVSTIAAKIEGLNGWAKVGQDLSWMPGGLSTGA